MARPGHLRVKGGTSLRGPISRKHWLASQRQEVTGFAFRDTYRTRCHELYEFASVGGYDLTVPLTETDGSNKGLNLTGGTSGVSVALFRVPAGGVITGVSFGSNSAVTQSGTNFFTITSANLLASGSGSATFLSTTTHVNTTDGNALAINGGSNLVAGVDYPLVLSATAANLNVATGDVLQVTATSTLTGSPTIAPYIRIHIATLPAGLTPLYQRTAGQPIVKVLSNTINGEAFVSTDATSEAQTAGFTMGDQLNLGKVDVTSPDLIGGPMIEFRLKPGTIAANDTLVFGIATAFNTTLSSISKYAWFRLNGNMNLTLESSDGTTTNTAVAPISGTVTLVAGTYYDFTIDMSDPTAVEFWMGSYGTFPVSTAPGSQEAQFGDDSLGTLSMAALAATDLFQPIVLVQKASGTDVITATVDYVSVFWTRQ